MSKADQKIVVAHGGDMDAVRQEVARTPYRDLRIKYSVQFKTVRRWKAEYAATAPTLKSMTAIQRAHHGDMDAVRAEMESAEIYDLASKYGVHLDAVYKWERNFGARCLRVCKTHGGPVRYDQLRVKDNGQLSSSCVDCPEYRAPVLVRKKPGVKRLDETYDELRSVQPLVAMTSQPISPGPTYWQKRGEWILSNEYEMEGV